MGSLSTITLNMEQSIPEENKWILVTNYTGGADDRSFTAIIEYDPSSTTPSLHYISEEPRLHYVSCTICMLSLETSNLLISKGWSPEIIPESCIVKPRCAWAARGVRVVFCYSNAYSSATVEGVD